MEIKKAEFIISNSDIKKCPAPNMPEYAFIGRSNVGKSSLINLLTNNSSLAKISTNPGKTQLINHFLIDETWYLVDLPGYGYAKVARQKREAWSKFLKKYINERENLVCLFVLIDSRIEPQTIDLDFMEQLGINEVPFVMVFTKSDKLTNNELAKNIEAYKKTMFKNWEEIPKYFITSTTTKTGKSEILTYISELNKTFTNE